MRKTIIPLSLSDPPQSIAFCVPQQHVARFGLARFYSKENVWNLANFVLPDILASVNCFTPALRAKRYLDQCTLNKGGTDEKPIRQHLQRS
jgi:hypothetical protein